MKKLIFFSFALSQLFYTQAQSWTWAETAGGVLPDEANGCAMDNSGNMYASGFFFSSSINFNSGNSISNGGICDGFVVKYNSSGNSQWATKVKGNGEDKATRCAVDLNGNVIATGYFDSPSIQFGGNNAHNVSNSGGSGTFDAFIVKYNSAGTPQWFHSIGQADDDGGSSVAFDASGNVFVTGWFRAPSIAVGTFTLYNENPAGGSSDMFIIKYDPNGNVLWAKCAGSRSDDDKGNGCVVDRSGNVVVAGYLKGDSINFEGTYHHKFGSKDGFVAKYSAAGTLLQAKVFGGSGNEEPFACSADLNGNIFVSGTFSSSNVLVDAVTIANAGGAFDAFLIKLNPSLNALWAINVGSSDDDEGRGCSTDMYGNTVVTGTYTGSSVTIGSTVLNNNGGEEIFLAKYDAGGNLFWAKKAGKSNDDGANDCAIDNNGRVLMVGYYNSGSLTFGNIDLDNSYVGIATSDVFAATTCNTQKGTDTRTACNSFTWIDGTTYTASNNTAVFNFPSGASNTCDSLVTLNLTINTADASIATTGSTITANAANASYRWLACNDNFAFMAGETGQIFTATANGSYAVEVTQNSCADTSDCVAISISGVEKDEAFYQIKIYPNPGNGLVNIDFETLRNVSVNVININGQLVFKEENIDSTAYQFELKQPAGIYFVELITKAEKLRYKLMLE